MDNQYTDWTRLKNEDAADLILVQEVVQMAKRHMEEKFGKQFEKIEYKLSDYDENFKRLDFTGIIN